MADEAGEASVTTPTGETVTVPLEAGTPGVFVGLVETDEIGLYRIANGDLETLAHVGPVNAPEFTDTVSTTERLRPIAQASGGTVRRIEAGLTGALDLPNIVPVRPGANADGRGWVGLQTTNDSVLRSVSRVPLFAGFFGLALLLFAFGATWYREGR
jgi:hypothetical protein